jgi:hypothetical protein
VNLNRGDRRPATTSSSRFVDPGDVAVISDRTRRPREGPALSSRRLGPSASLDARADDGADVTVVCRETNA